MGTLPPEADSPGTEGDTTHRGGPADLAEPALVFWHLLEVQGRVEAGEMERAQAPAFTAEELALAATRIAIVVIRLCTRQHTRVSFSVPEASSRARKGMETHERVLCGRARNDGPPRKLLSHLGGAAQGIIRVSLHYWAKVQRTERT